MNILLSLVLKLRYLCSLPGGMFFLGTMESERHVEKRQKNTQRCRNRQFSCLSNSQPVRPPANQPASLSVNQRGSQPLGWPVRRLVSQSSCQSNSQPVDPSVSLSSYQKLNDLYELQEDRPCANSHLDSVYPCARTGTQAHTKHHPQ